MHQIKVACLKTDSTTFKGKILENLAEMLLKSQNYSVESTVRMTGVELDLLCKHNISGRQIYIECKAYHDNTTIPAETISKLCGIKNIKNYYEAWLVTTAPLSKDAKGLVKEINSGHNGHEYSFYTPEKLIETFTNAKIIQSGLISEAKVKELIKKDKTGNVSLVISDRGNYWAVECLSSGSVSGIIFTDAQNSEIVTDESLLNFFTETEIFAKEIKCNKVQEYFENKISYNICPDLIKLSEAYIVKINEIGVRITHPGKDELVLDDIFVYPHLEIIDDDRNGQKIISSKLSELGTEFNKVLIFGDDVSGKTTLAYKLQRDIERKGMIPLYINADDIKYADEKKFNNLLKNSFKKQYIG
ncbi:MAG: restriction endonuclease, partial [bacterium]